MALEQTAETRDQQLAFAEHVAPLFDRDMHREESIDQVAVGEDVAREIRDFLDAEILRELLQRETREVHRAIFPALAPAHATAMGLFGIEDEERRGSGFLDPAATAHDRAALLRHRDDQRVMRMQRVFVGREVGVQQAEPGEMPVPPVLRRVAGIAARHGAIYTNTGRGSATSLWP